MSSSSLAGETTSNPLLERGLSGFLQLAPTTSPSHPQTQRSRQSQHSKAAPLETAPAPAVAPAQDPELLKRRSSSVGSEGSQKSRFLKLGPVHWGVHMEDHQSDFAVVE